MGEEETAQPVIELARVSFAISGRPLISDLESQVASGEALVLLGRTGSGKSTTLKLVNGLLMPTGGHVYVEGRAADHARRKE